MRIKGGDKCKILDKSQLDATSLKNKQNKKELKNGERERVIKNKKIETLAKDDVVKNVNLEEKREEIDDDESNESEDDEMIDSDEGDLNESEEDELNDSEEDELNGSEEDELNDSEEDELNDSEEDELNDSEEDELNDSEENDSEEEELSESGEERSESGDEVEKSGDLCKGEKSGKEVQENKENTDSIKKIKNKTHKSEREHKVRKDKIDREEKLDEIKTKDCGKFGHMVDNKMDVNKPGGDDGMKESEDEQTQNVAKNEGEEKADPVTVNNETIKIDDDEDAETMCMSESDLVAMLVGNKKMFNLKSKDVMQFFDVIYPLIFVKCDATGETPAEMSSLPSQELPVVLPRACGPMEVDFDIQTLDDSLLLDVVFDKMAQKKRIPMYKLEYRQKIDMGNIVPYSDQTNSSEQNEAVFDNMFGHTIHRANKTDGKMYVDSCTYDSIKSYIYRIKLAVAAKGNERPKEIQTYDNILVYKDCVPLDNAMESLKDLLFGRQCTLETEEASKNRNRPCYLMRDGVNGPEVSFQIFDSKYNLNLDERHIAMVCRAKGKSKPAEMHIAFTKQFLCNSPQFKDRFQVEYTELLDKLEPEDVIYLPLFFDPSKSCFRSVNWFWGAWRNSSFNVLNTMWVHTKSSCCLTKGKPIQCPINFVEVYLAKINSIKDLRVFKHIGDNLMRKRLEWLHCNYPSNEIVVWHKNKILLKELLDINVTVPKAFVQCGYVSTHRANLQVMTDAVVDLFVDEREKNKFQGIAPNETSSPVLMKRTQPYCKGDDPHSNITTGVGVNMQNEMHDASNCNAQSQQGDDVLCGDAMTEKNYLSFTKRKYEDLAAKSKAKVEELMYNFELEKELIAKRQKVELETTETRAMRQAAWHTKLAEQYATLANEIFM